MQSILEQMCAHAKGLPREEVCGLIIANSQKSVVLRGENIARDKTQHFHMNPDLWLQVPDGWEVVATYHSHPFGVVEPSGADLSMCESSQMPMHIVCGETSAHKVIQPCGYEAPYKGRVYCFGVHDCYSLVRDWYKRELGIDLIVGEEQRHRFNRGENVYVESFESAGFVQVTNMPVCHGDVFLLQVGAKYPNHAAIWLDSGRILHHVIDRVSKEDHWAGYWVQHTTHHLRHKTRL